MSSHYDPLRRLIESLRTAGFFERIFGWGKIKMLLFDANGELQKLITKTEEASRLDNSLQLEKMNVQNLNERVMRLSNENEGLKEANKQIESLQKELSALNEKNNNFYRRGTELSNEAAILKQKLELTERDLQRTLQLNTELNKEEEFRKQEHAKSIALLSRTQEKLQNERSQELEDRKTAEIERIRKLRETWSNHQESVKNSIKSICARHTIDYVDKVPFRGEPDNTLRISNEYIVFDAKSPGSDDLSNFRQYIRNQAEAAKKYVKEPDVKKDIFLVVPVSTLEILDQLVFRLADYSVFVISLDSLEPVILCLQKIEEYEFAEQMSPEERDNICRILGKFVHLSKRRIQIDGFFTKQFFELVYRSEADLPKDFLEKVSEFEKAEKLNPPIERRSKQISAKELEQDTTRLKNEAESKGIITEEGLLSSRLNKLPLYSAEADKKETDQHELF